MRYDVKLPSEIFEQRLGFPVVQEYAASRKYFCVGVPGNHACHGSLKENRSTEKAKHEHSSPRHVRLFTRVSPLSSPSSSNTIHRKWFICLSPGSHKRTGEPDREKRYFISKRPQHICMPTTTQQLPQQNGRRPACARSRCELENFLIEEADSLTFPFPTLMNI